MSNLREAARQSAAILRGTEPVPGGHIDNEGQAVGPVEHLAAVMRVPADDHAARPVELDKSIEASTSAISVHEAYSRVMGDVQYVAKNGQRSDSGGRYRFRGIDALLQAVGPALRKHGLIFVPGKIISKEYDQIPTAGGKVMQRCKVTVSYAAIGPAGDVFPLPIESVGEAFDSGDKAGSKAMSVALRTAYIQAFAIPVEQPEMDPEHGPQYEVATPPRASAEELRDEVISPTISLARISEISDELKQRRAAGDAVGVELVADPAEQGGNIRLIDLVYRVGRELKA